MARRSRDDLLRLGLSLLRCNRAGAGLRLRQSCWLGLPTPFKLSGRFLVHFEAILGRLRCMLDRLGDITRPHWPSWRHI
eukprot:878794-Pyramimonas_sp.AAC.1